MIWRRFFRPGPARRAGGRLYERMVAQARAPWLYAELGAPDTPDGRFELYTLHVLLALGRLEGGGPAAGAVAQSLFDAYLSGLDHGLRELAVGDLAVGRTMRRLGEAFYGRRVALGAALAALPDAAPLEALVGRTVFSGAADRDPAPIAAYVAGARDRLAAAPLDEVIEGAWSWPSCA